MTGIQLVRSLLERNQYSLEVFWEVCSVHEELGSVIALVERRLPDVLREITIDEYARFMERNPWILDALWCSQKGNGHTNGNGHTVYFANFAERLPRTFKQDVKDEQAFIAALKLHVWLCHARLYDNLNIRIERAPAPARLSLHLSSSTVLWQHIAEAWRTSTSWVEVAHTLQCSIDQLREWVIEHVESATVPRDALTRLLINAFEDDAPLSSADELSYFLDPSSGIVLSIESHKLIRQACEEADMSEGELLVSLYHPSNSWEVARRFRMPLSTYLRLVKYHAPDFFHQMQSGGPT